MNQRSKTGPVQAGPTEVASTAPSYELRQPSLEVKKTWRRPHDSTNLSEPDGG